MHIYFYNNETNNFDHVYPSMWEADGVIRVASYYERFSVDVVEVQGQNVVFAANIHAVMILIHAQDAIVWCVQQVREVMGCTCRPQICRMRENIQFNQWK